MRERERAEIKETVTQRMGRVRGTVTEQPKESHTLRKLTKGGEQKTLNVEGKIFYMSTLF